MKGLVWKLKILKKQGVEPFAKLCETWPVLDFKDQVHCFSMQVVTNKCFLLNREKEFGTDPSCRYREKRKNAYFNFEK